MLTTDFGPCEWFVWDLRQSNLVDREHLDQIAGEFLQAHPGAEPKALAEHLVDQGLITPFQAERLLEGRFEGFILGPFTLMDALGSGSMGTVYKAQSKTDSRWYAVKVLPRRSMWNVRVARRKVKVFEQCQHPSVVPFVDVGTAGGMHYLAWPLVAGETLDKIVADQGKRTAEQTASLGVQVAEGLELCHHQGLFHGLLKPSNLMIGADNEVRILDFGIGCLLAELKDESLVDTSATANSISSGLDCSSPESILDPTNLTPLGDQYSLGCVLYFCLTGSYPFPGGAAIDKMIGHQLKEPAPIKDLNPDAPVGLVAVVERLMKKAPAERFSSAGAVAEALRGFMPASQFEQIEALPTCPIQPSPVVGDSLPDHRVGQVREGEPPAEPRTPRLSRSFALLETPESTGSAGASPSQRLPIDDRGGWKQDLVPLALVLAALLAGGLLISSLISF